MAVSEEFKRMKEKSAETLEFLRGRLRFHIGRHRKTKLLCLGELKDRTLLTPAVAEKHAERLEKQFVSRWGRFTKREMNERLRFLTVLSLVVPLDVEKTLEAVEQMYSRLSYVCKGIRGMELIGAAEIEVVNTGKMKAMAGEDDEIRKLNVILSMLPPEEKTLFRTGATSYALVHFHGIVDLGMKGEENAGKLRTVARQYWEQPYMVQVKGLYSTKTVKKNLADIAAYLTKGGNETLIYKNGFGWDKEDKINRQLIKVGRATMDKDFDGFENELSLTIAEIKFLGEAIDRLMIRTGSKNLRNGYLFKYGQRKKWVG
jgi:hypothetical protein